MIKLFPCTCSCAGLVVDYNKNIDDGVFVSMWRAGINYNTGLRNRLRHIRYIICHGHPWTDDVILSVTDARELARELLKITDGEQ